MEIYAFSAMYSDKLLDNKCYIFSNPKKNGYHIIKET